MIRTWGAAIGVGVAAAAVAIAACGDSPLDPREFCDPEALKAGSPQQTGDPTIDACLAGSLKLKPPCVALYDCVRAACVEIVAELGATPAGIGWNLNAAEACNAAQDAWQARGDISCAAMPGNDAGLGDGGDASIVVACAASDGGAAEAALATLLAASLGNLLQCSQDPGAPAPAELSNLAKTCSDADAKRPPNGAALMCLAVAQEKAGLAKADCSVGASVLAFVSAELHAP